MKLRLFRPLAAFATASYCLAADADKIIYPGATAASAEAAANPGGGGALTVVAFLVLAGAGAWLLWRGRGKPGSGSGADGRQLAIAETRSLGNRQYLVVASYDGKKFLLGVCPGRIDLLAPLDGPMPFDKPRA